ncbi:MAG: cytochrome C oxidase subunit IV family protein [Rhodoferax sp.]
MVRTLNRIWLFLLVATAATFALGESGWAARTGLGAVLLVFALAFAKAYWVVYDFMELRHAPPLWQRLLIGWLVLVVGGIVLAYAVGARAG